MKRASLPLVVVLALVSWASGQITEGDWTYIVENGGVTINASTATGDVTIPSSLGGLPVKTVGRGVQSSAYRLFGQNSASVASVIIPNGVTSIGAYTFNDCTSLTSVSIPNSVTSIGGNAFRGCSSLTSITIPNSMTSIGSGAFSNCTGLTSVSIPNSVTSIGGNAFQFCTNLNSITIPNSVTSIGSYAFDGCSSLTGITIPNSVTSIGSQAFQRCSSLTSITIPNGVTSIGAETFNNCTSLTSVIIPNGVTSIGGSAFSNCTSLTRVSIPSSVTSIVSNTFQNCTSLTKVFLPPQFETTYLGLGLAASQVIFYDVSAESQWTYFIENGGATITASTATGAVTIPPSLRGLPVNTVGDGSNPVFGFGSTSVTSVALPDSVASIGVGAFANCAGLTTISGVSPALAIDIRFSGVSSQLASDGLIQALADTLATNSTFITNLAEAIKSANGTYGITTQTGLSSAIEPLATKAEITTAINEGKAAGIASVTASPNNWHLFTTSQIQNMAVGDLVLTKEVDGSFILNYDIEQSTDLQTWTPYQAMSLPLTSLPTDKAFIRIRLKE